MFRLTGFIIGVLIGLFFTRSFLLGGAPRGGMTALGDLAIGGITISYIAGLGCG